MRDDLMDGHEMIDNGFEPYERSPYYGDDDYDDEWYEDYDNYDYIEPTFQAKLVIRIRRLAWKLGHWFRLCTSKHYREHHDDIPF